MHKESKANLNPVRQRTQYTCMSTAMAMCLNALGLDCTEDEVNNVMGARPMKGATWESALACAQHYGVRATLTTPATLNQVKSWTDAGNPVMIAWNPEGRPWSHASVIFDVDDSNVHVADPNIPDPDETVRVIPKKDFYGKWYEKWPNYLVRRPALKLEREITPEGRQVLASKRWKRAGSPLKLQRDYGDEEMLSTEEMEKTLKRTARRKARATRKTAECGGTHHHPEEIDLMPLDEFEAFTAEEKESEYDLKSWSFTAEDEKEARFTEGPEGEKEFDEWMEDQSEDFQEDWEENTDKYEDKFKNAYFKGRKQSKARQAYRTRTEPRELGHADFPVENQSLSVISKHLREAFKELRKEFRMNSRTFEFYVDMVLKNF